MPGLRQRWDATWQRLYPVTTPAAAMSDALFEELERRYREPQRHYHTLTHLTECFAALDVKLQEVVSAG